MKFLGKILFVGMAISSILNALIFIATVIKLLSNYIGFFAYIAWIFVAHIFSPTFLFLPWFEAWVEGESVSENIVLIWLSFWVFLILRGVFWKWAPDK